MLVNRIIDILKSGPSGPALISRDREVSFPEFRRLASGAASFLRDAGVGKGSHAAILLPDGIDYCVSYAALWLLGAVAVPLHMGMKPATVEGLVAHSDCEFLIMHGSHPTKSGELKSKAPSLKWVASDKEDADAGLEFLSREGEADEEFPDTDESGACGIFYTSGTTGRPKGIVWNYRHLGSPLMTLEHFLGMPGDDTMICAAPLSHAGGLVYFLGCLKWHTPVVMMERFAPGAFLRNIEKHGVTCCFLVPAMFGALVRSPDFEAADLSSLRWVATFGAVADLASLEKLQAKCPDLLIINGWGMMESGPPNTLPHLAREEIDIRGVGFPVPWVEMKIVDEDGAELPPGESGEVALKGWVVMDGYYKEPGLTAETVRNGWLFSGDIGRFDERGYLYIIGRKKNVIIVGGLNVQATEVERALEGHPRVAQAAITGAPDPVRGEAVKAHIVAASGAAIGETELVEFCRERLEAHKVPAIFEFVEELPRTATGKVARWLLK